MYDRHSHTRSRQVSMHTQQRWSCYPRSSCQQIIEKVRDTTPLKSRQRKLPSGHIWVAQTGAVKIYQFCLPMVSSSSPDPTSVRRHSACGVIDLERPMHGYS
ncbi:hypothetical protein M404DRAFT_648132 [Pisolithus tinctorius Marx 270]|uniref:Uncharacterized protein n=1 Tax=Pisolithus tinctorius Marx 270 TaxID=870435 RepID=A0A0C3J058_PISTI|nr:hypothetical protein M404DRAFT_648132 [Pisolithus tinctorius Marx 270]